METKYARCKTCLKFSNLIKVNEDSSYRYYQCVNCDNISKYRKKNINQHNVNCIDCIYFLPKSQCTRRDLNNRPTCIAGFTCKPDCKYKIRK